MKYQFGTTVIKPSEVYSEVYKLAQITRVLSLNYGIIDFRPPKEGEKYITLYGEIFLAYEDYDVHEPRLIIHKKVNFLSLDQVWE